MQQTQKIALPIDTFLPSIAAELRSCSTLILKAPPGTGKTTRLPWSLTQSFAGKVIVLEPRRLAAKLAAARIAGEENLSLGKEVGYHFRFDRNFTSATRLIFYTEGTFLRSLERDPMLSDVDLVVIDEFHERNLETDVALAYLRSLQLHRPELKLVIMSATLDAKLSEALPNVRTLDIPVHHFDVEISYLPNQPSILQQSLEQKVHQALRGLPPDSGDVLIFLPGMREMLSVEGALGATFGKVFLLHADLPADRQNDALAPAPQRKIILSTNVAESSLTIPGIRVVIDSGIQRSAEFSPWHGMKYIVDVPVTQSSAVQRAGRAGRQGPGFCYRLYSRQDFDAREAFTVPEILKADLSDLVLSVATFKLPLSWLQPPPAERWDLALELCRKLGALTSEGDLTPVGLAMQSYPLGARLSRALVAGEPLSATKKQAFLKFICEEIEKDKRGTLLRRLAAYRSKDGPADTPWELCILRAFPDQVAKLRREKGDLIHYSGKTLRLHPKLQDLGHDFYVVLEITRRQEAILILPVEEEWLYDLEPFPFTEETSFSSGEDLSLRHETRLGSILIESSTQRITWTGLSEGDRKKFFAQASKTFVDKVDVWRETPDFARLLYFGGLRGLDLGSLSFKVEDYFEWAQDLSWTHLPIYLLERTLAHLGVSSLEAELPQRLKLGNGREFQVHYPLGADPYLEGPIQDFYGLKETPTLKHGGPLTLKILGPHKRPLQVTKDLAGFWARTYGQLKKELFRDYPRHHWADEPSTARPVLLKRQL